MPKIILSIRNVAKACVLPAITLGLILTAAHDSLAQNLINSDGRAMQNQVRVFYIYWTPPGVVLDTTPANGTGNFRAVLEQFPDDVNGSAYLNILTQYPGMCSGTPCVLRNGSAAVTLGGGFVDTTAYPGGRGTAANPLSDADIQTAVIRAITTNGWTANLNSIFFVITGVFSANGAVVEECRGGACTFNTFCGYHDHFTSGGVDIRYSYLSDATFNTGCPGGVTTAANGQLSTDREVVLMTHELFETVTDPEINTWVDSAGAELSDKCNANILATNQTPLTLNGRTYNVQLHFSNASSSCVSAFGPSIKLTIGTGSDDLRGNSAVTAALQGPASTTFGTFTLKALPDVGWGNNTTHVGAGPFGATTSSSLGRVALTLTSFPALFQNGDDWVIQSALIEVLSPAGVTLCSESLSGNPLASLGPSLPTASFDTPNCLPPAPALEGIECRVFDDGYSNMTVPSGAVFINGANQACIPDGTASGTCRKWFGRCSTVANVPVVFNAFNDGYTSLVGTTDAVFINGQRQACIPDGTAAGTCRKWFGRGQTNDGRSAMCTVFDDGNTNKSIASDAVFINANRQSCIPDGTAQGRCSRWWGLCSTAATAAPAGPIDDASLTFSAAGSLTVGSQATVSVTATNTGTSTWGPGYSLNLLRSGRISLPANSVAIVGTVGPGQSRALSFQVQCNSQGFGGFSAQMSGSNIAFGNSVGQNILCQP